MSWVQGVQERDTLPAKFLAWADAQGAERGWGELEYITWFDTEPDTVFLDYGEHGSLRVSLEGTPFARR